MINYDTSRKYIPARYEILPFTLAGRKATVFYRHRLQKEKNLTETVDYLFD